MRALLIVLVLLGAFAAVPVAQAHHISPCDPDYPCNPTPCSWKCWVDHVKYCALKRYCW